MENLVFKQNINVDENNNITNFNEYLTQVLSALDIQDDSVKNAFNDFDNTQKYKLMNNTNIINKLIELIEADKELTSFWNKNKDYFDENNQALKKNWEEMKQHLGKLQGLILLQKIQKQKDCTPVMDGIVSALNKKLNLVNDILTENLKQDQQEEQQQGGGMYRRKFNKYVKKNIMIQKSF